METLVIWCVGLLFVFMLVLMVGASISGAMEHHNTRVANRKYNAKLTAATQKSWEPIRYTREWYERHPEPPGC